MIPEYKLCHGAVLAEIVHDLDKPVMIDELVEDGRLSSYILNDRIGLRVKHSTQRLSPWPFTFTNSNMLELLDLRDRCDNVYIVFVGSHLGMVCLTIEEMLEIGDPGGSGQLWIRIERSRGKWFSVFGAKGKLTSKKPNGLNCMLEALQNSQGPEIVQAPSPSRTSKPSRFSSVWRAMFQ